MVYFDELTTGVVMHFDNRHGKMFGHLRITAGADELIGHTVWFHYGDGLFLLPNDDTASWANPMVFTADTRSDYTTPHVGANLPEWRSLAIPKEGDTIVFEWSTNNQGDIAKPWTYEGHFKEVATRAGFSLRIVDQHNTVLWSGLYSRDTDTICSQQGNLPTELDGWLFVEYYVPDDIVDGAGGSGLLIPGGWKRWHGPILDTLNAAQPVALVVN